MDRLESRLAVLIPCHNEELTIADVIEDFRHELPEADIFVFDNCSTDATADVARKHGAIVLRECRKGKGFVVASMFDRIDADAYLLVDGDNTYPAEYARALLEPVLAGDADMVVGARLTNHTSNSFPRLHLFGNQLVAMLVNWVSGTRLTDIMSGYRAFNRQVVRRIPVVSSGFEVETDMTLQVLYYRLKIIELCVPYRQRIAGSVGKLRTFHDGFLALWKIFSLFRVFKPLTFFGSMGCCSWSSASWPVSGPSMTTSRIPLTMSATCRSPSWRSAWY